MLLVFLEPLVQQELQGQQDPQEPLELKVLLVGKVPLGLVLRVRQVPLVQPVLLDQEQQDLQDPQDQQVLLEQLALEAQPGQQDPLDQLAPQEHLEVQQVLLVLQVQVQLVLLDH